MQEKWDCAVYIPNITAQLSADRSAAVQHMRPTLYFLAVFVCNLCAVNYAFSRLSSMDLASENFHLTNSN